MVSLFDNSSKIIFKRGIGKVNSSIISSVKEVFNNLSNLTLLDKVATINEIRKILSGYSPFKEEPIDCVQWVDGSFVVANDYNPNTVAPPEMALLEHSILSDGYTQPIVSFLRDDGSYEVVDGFHRNRVGKESAIVKGRLNGFLPLSVINQGRSSRSDRIAATIRHNRARGKHQVERMSDIVIELKRRNWSDDRIAKELGMDADEVLRLCQISGLTELFSNKEFSKSWSIDCVSEEELSFELEESNIEKDKELKEGRIVHTYEKWECYKAGFYFEHPPKGMSDDECTTKYKELLTDIPLFKSVLAQVITKWKNSCEHYLTNIDMNRIAWLGQASLCFLYGIPSKYRSGFNLLTDEEKEKANRAACVYLNKWLKLNGYLLVVFEDLVNNQPKADLY